MNYLSVCSGIEAATVAWHHMGWKPVGYSEIEKFPSQVLAHHYPKVPNFGDMTKYKEWNINDTVGLLVGGTPCQSFSVAGLRKGLEDPRGNLALTYCAILDHFRPKWFVWENVPGVLSSNGGRDFGSFLGALGELGYGWAYRVLDAQWFGVPQRRRRVFILAIDARRYSDPDSAAAVLAVGTRCGRNHQAERKAWSESSDRTGRSADIARQSISSKWSKQSSGPSGDEHHHLVYGVSHRRSDIEVSGSLTGRYGKGINTSIDDGAIVIDGSSSHPSRMRASHGLAGRMDRVNNMEAKDIAGNQVSATLRGFGHGWQGQQNSTHSVFVKSRRAQNDQDFETWVDGSVMPTLNQFDGSDTRATGLIAETGVVTSLSKSFGSGGPDSAHALAGWIVPGYEGGADEYLPEGLDSNRYRAIGNGVASPVAEWIGRRLIDWLQSHTSVPAGG